MADQSSRGRAPRPAPENRRQALIEAAYHHLARRGFEGFRLRLVAADGGIDHSTLHHYFPTKEDLVAAVLDHVTRRFWNTLPDEGAADRRLRHHLLTLAAMIRQEPSLFTVLVEFDLRGQRDPAVRQVIERDEAGWREALMKVWRQGQQEGAWALDLEPATAVELVISVIKGVRLMPDQAESVLAQFQRTLTERSRPEGSPASQRP